MKPGELTSRQWWLYNFLGKHPDGWFDEVDIAISNINDLGYGGERYELTANPKGSKCSAIWSDMEAINFSYETDKIIITKNRSYKMASSKDEIDEFYLNTLHEKAMRALVRCSIITKKVKADGQGKLLTLKGVELTEESRAKRFIEAFVGGIEWGKEKE